MRRIYWRQRLTDFKQYWLNPTPARQRGRNNPLLLSERLEDRIVLAAPMAMDDAAETTEDTTVSGNLLADNGNGADSDSDGDTLTVTEVNGNTFTIDTPILLDSGALLTITSTDGDFTYDPNGAFEDLTVNESRDDIFTYTIDDGNNGTDSATVTVHVTGENDVPVGMDQTFGITENQSVMIDLRGDPDSNALFSDADTNDTLTYFYNDGSTEQELMVGQEVTLISGATLTLNNDETLTYDPQTAFDFLAVGAAGSDNFSILARDDSDQESTSNVTINVTGEDDATVVINEEFPVSGELFENESITIDLNGATGSDAIFHDPDDTLRYYFGNAVDGDNELVVDEPITLTSGATITLNSDGTLTYDPGQAFDDLAAQETDTDSFMITAWDGTTNPGGQQTRNEVTADITITLTGANDPPVVSTTIPDQTNDDGDSVNLNVSGNFSDVDGSALTFEAAGLPDALSIDMSMGIISGTLASDASQGGTDGVYEVTVTVTDEAGGTVSDTFNWTVNNPPPVVSSPISDQASNDGDTVTLNVSGNFSDDDTLTFSATGLPDELTINSMTGVISGTLAAEASQGGTDGVYEVTVTVSDGEGGTVSDTFNWTVNNPAPTAQDDSFTTDEDTATSGNVLVDNGNGADSDPDGDTLQVSEVNGESADVGTEIELGSGALLQLNSDGTFTYDPNGAFEDLAVGESREDKFTYTIDDGNGGIDDAEVTITVNGVNDAPVGTSRTYDITENETLTIRLRNGSDPLFTDLDTNNQLTYYFEGQALVVGVSRTLDSGATITLSGNGANKTLIYEPGTAFDFLAESEMDMDMFTITASDGSVDSGGLPLIASADVTINISGVNDAPVGTDKVFAINEDQTVQVVLRDADNPGALFFDADLSDTLTYFAEVVRNGSLTEVELEVDRVETLSSGATITLVDNGGILSLIYDPDDSLSGEIPGDPIIAAEQLIESLDIVAKDSQDAEATANLEITVTGLNDPPQGTTLTFDVVQDETIPPITLRGDLETGALFSDPDVSDTLIYFAEVVRSGVPMVVELVPGTVEELSSGATIRLNSDGTLTYDQNDAFDHLAEAQPGNDSLTITAQDRVGSQATGNVEINITGLNDSPTLTSADLNVLRDYFLRIIHNGLLPAGQRLSLVPEIPFFPTTDEQIAQLLSSGIVEGEQIRLPITITDPDDNDLIDAELFLAKSGVYDGTPESILSNPDSVVSLGSIQFTAQSLSSGVFRYTFSETITDDFPTGTSSDDLVFVLLYHDRLGASENSIQSAGVTESGFSSDAQSVDSYTVYNFNPILYTGFDLQTQIPPELQDQAAQISTLSEGATIQFLLNGNEFVATLFGFVLETGDPNESADPPESLTGTLFDDLGDVLGGTVTVKTESLLPLNSIVFDSSGNLSFHNTTLGRFFSATFTIPVTQRLVNSAGTRLEATFLIQDDDGGQSTLSGLTVQFPPFVIPQQDAAVAEEEVVLESQEIQAETSRIPTIARTIERTQTPLSGETEEDTFEVVVRVVIDDREDVENDEPLYEEINLFGTEDEEDEGEQSEETIDEARNRLEQFLQMIPQLPDNHYQIVLLQKRGGLLVSRTVILDVIVQDGEIIERQGQVQNNGEQAETTDSKPENAPALPQDTSGQQEQTGEQPEDKSDRVGAVALPALAIAEFRKRRKKAESEQARRLEEQVPRANFRKSVSLWSTLFRVSSGR